MGFWGKLFSKKAAPQQEAAPTASTERFGSTETEHSFFSEKTDANTAWEAQRAAEQAAKETEEREILALTDAKSTPIVASEKTSAGLPEEEFQQEKIAS